MDNASELADYLDDQREKMEHATAEMWKMMAGWSREQMIDAGLLVYSGMLKDVAHFAGVYEQDDWFADRRALPALQAADERRVRRLGDRRAGRA